jgi:hypothetical protein
MRFLAARESNPLSHKILLTGSHGVLYLVPPLVLPRYALRIENANDFTASCPSPNSAAVSPYIFLPLLVADLRLDFTLRCAALTFAASRSAARCGCRTVRPVCCPIICATRTSARVCGLAVMVWRCWRGVLLGSEFVRRPFRLPVAFVRNLCAGVPTHGCKSDYSFTRLCFVCFATLAHVMESPAVAHLIHLSGVDEASKHLRHVTGLHRHR